MLIYHCDICKRKISEKEAVIFAGIGNNFTSMSFCVKCGNPVKKFLEKNKLLDISNQKK